MAEITHFYAEDTTQRLTVNDTWTDTNTTDGVGKIAGSNLAANTKYLIVARGMLAGDADAELVGLRLSCADDSDIATYSEQTMGVYSASVPYRYFWVWSYTTDSSPADIQWQFISPSTDGVYADQMVLWAFEYDTGVFTEAKSTDTTTELDTGLGDIVEITGLDSGTEYLVLGHARIAAGSVSFYESVQLVDSSSLLSSIRVPEDTADVMTHPVFGQVSGETSVKIAGNEEDAAANHIEAGAYLVAIDTSAFGHFDYAYTSGLQGVQNVDESIQSVSFTRANASANHLIVGGARLTSDAGDWRLWHEYNSVDVLAGDSATYLADGNSANDAPSVLVMSREVFGSDATADLMAYQSQATDENAFYRFLAILDLTLPGVAPGPPTRNAIVFVAAD